MNSTLSPVSNRSNDLLSDFRSEFDQLFDRFWPSESDGNGSWSPTANLSETEKAYELSLDLPGMTPEDFEIELKNGELWITGERKSSDEEKGRTWHRVESHYGKFRRVFRLGDGVDPENVDAEYHEGVLLITVPKTESAKTRHIPIRS